MDILSHELSDIKSLNDVTKAIALESLKLSFIWFVLLWLEIGSAYSSKASGVAGFTTGAESLVKMAYIYASVMCACVYVIFA